MTIRTDYIKVIFGTLVLIYLIDLLGLIAWIYSNQSPVDGFYIGAINANILKFILF
jgi:hypothetical protein